jgi:hypothetical protein
MAALQACLGTNRNSTSKVTNIKRAEGVAQVVKHQPSKSEAPEFNLQYHQKKKKKKSHSTALNA